MDIITSAKIIIAVEGLLPPLYIKKVMVKHSTSEGRSKLFLLQFGSRCIMCVLPFTNDLFSLMRLGGSFKDYNSR